MFLNTITDFASSSRGKWVILALWIVIAGAIIPVAPTLTEVTENDTLQFLPGDAESTRAAELVREKFPTAGTPAIIVFRNEDGLTDEDFAAGQAIYDGIAGMRDEPNSDVSGIVSIYNIPQARADLVSADNTAMTMIVTITGSASEEPYINRIEAIRDVTEPYDGVDLQTKVSGPGGLIADLVSVFAEVDLFLLLVTAVLVLVLLVLIYRSPVVALVPLLIVGVVFQLAGGIAALTLRELDFPINGQSSGIMTVILFGAGTDYYLFIASRYREELRRRTNKHEAMRVTMRAVAEAILSAGGTLMVASLLLLLADLGSYRALGPIIAIATFIMILAAITLIPAVLAIIGRNGFWPFRPMYDSGTAEAEAQSPDSRLWTRIAHVVLERPERVLTVTTAALVLLIGGMAFLNPNYDSLESLPSTVDSVEGFALLRESFPAGELAPTSIYVQLPDGETIFDEGNLAAVDAISRAIREMNGVAGVTGPANPFGVDVGPGLEQVQGAAAAIPQPIRQEIDAARASGASGPPPGAGQGSDPALGEAIGLYVSALGFASADRSVAEIEVTLNTNPYGTDAMDLIPDLRDIARDTAEENGLSRTSVLVGGDTPENVDTRTANTRDTFVVLPVILLSIMVILGLLLRSVVAALYLGVTIIVTYFATLGFSILVFRYVFGQETIGNGVPFLLFLFLNALGVDYSIYLMSRVREEARTFDLRHATERALVRTGGVITSAGIILAGTFAALMTLPLQDLFQLGFAVAAGVLIDTFVTRSLLVPSIVMLLGKWNWWPNHSRMDAAVQAEPAIPAPQAGN